MPKTITVPYTRQSGDETCSIGVTYQIDKQGSEVMIICSVTQENAATSLQWLNMKRFEVKTIFSRGAYSLMYDDTNHDTNLDTSMFIDTAFGAIMKHEKMRVA